MKQKIHELAVELFEFAKEIDYYDFTDKVTNKEEVNCAIKSIETDLHQNNIQPYMDALYEYIEENAEESLMSTLPAFGLISGLATLRLIKSN